MNHTQATRPLPVLLFSNAGTLRVPVCYESPQVVDMLFDAFIASLRGSRQWADVKCRGLDLGGEPLLGMQPLRENYKALMDQKLDRHAFFRDNALITYEASLEMASTDDGADTYRMRLTDVAVPLTAFRGEVLLRLPRAGRTAGVPALLKSDVLAYAHRKNFQAEHLCHAKNLMVELYVQGNYKGVAMVEAPCELNALRAEYPEKIHLHTRTAACLPLSEATDVQAVLRHLDPRRITEHMDLASLLLSALLCYVFDVHIEEPVLVGQRPYVLGFLCGLKEGAAAGPHLPEPRLLLRGFARFATTRQHLTRLAKGLLTVLEEYAMLLQQRQAVLLPLARHMLRWAPGAAGQDPLHAAARAASDTLMGACMRLQEVLACMANPEAKASMGCGNGASPLNEELMQVLPEPLPAEDAALGLCAPMGPGPDAPDEDGLDMLPCLGNAQDDDDLEGLCL